uniref:Uncharacterized protein n=1 Tax=Anguilla anguilla TaxID=7936 RepID=A0A0E9RGF1_ANGAN
MLAMPRSRSLSSSRYTSVTNLRHTVNSETVVLVNPIQRIEKMLFS